MRGKEIITKLIIPGAIAMIICLIVHPMCMNGEILDWRKVLLFAGIPFGIQKMFLLVVPRNVGTGEMLGMLVLNLMVGSLIGIGVMGKTSSMLSDMPTTIDEQLEAIKKVYNFSERNIVPNLLSKEYAITVEN